MKKILLASILAGISINSVMAANVTGNFQATSTLNSTCTLSVDPVSFGEVNLLSVTQINKTSQINVLCTKGTAFYVEAVRPGPLYSMSGTATNTDKLNYNLYTTEAQTKTWGNRTGGSDAALEATATGVPQTIPFYALIHKAWNSELVKPDSYSDTVTAKITY